MRRVRAGGHRSGVRRWAWALVDDVDFDRVSEFKWSLINVKSYGPYAIHSHTKLLMHRFILEAAKGQSVDHVNGNGLDNRRQNLRFADTRQNAQNMRPKRGHSSRFKGVMWEKDRSRWVARIQADGRYRNLGRFDDEHQAARAYDAAALEHFGEFALTNAQMFGRSLRRTR